MRKAIVVLLSVFFLLNFSLSAVERLSICEIILHPNQMSAYEGKKIEIEGYAVEIQKDVWILAASPILLPCCKKNYEKGSLFLDPCFAKKQKGKKLSLEGVIEKRNERYYFLQEGKQNS